MAGGIGPAPKDPSQRVTRHQPQRGEWTDINPIDKPVLPPLGRDTPELKWTKFAREVWHVWRHDPVTSLWQDSDVMSAQMLIRLINDGKWGDSEARLRMDGLGLTPAGKRSLRWRTPGQPGTPGFTKPVVKSRAPVRNAARQARLSIVE